VRGWRERLSFFLWPRPPRNVVRIIMPNGQDALLYNLNVEEKQDGIIINTPLGKLRAPEKAALNLPIASIHLPGKPSPMLLVIYAITGLAIWFMTYYYGYLFSGFETNAFYWFYTILLGLFIYIYYTAASSTAMTEYLEFEGIAPPFLHAVPRNISPVRRAKYLNQPILIRVTKTAKESMRNLKRALSLQSDSEVAELMATGELVEVLFQNATRIRAGAMRVEKLLTSFEKARLAFSMGRITIGKVALMFMMFIVGLAVGLALGGTDIVVGPPPAPATPLVLRAHTRQLPRPTLARPLQHRPQPHRTLHRTLARHPQQGVEHHEARPLAPHTIGTSCHRSPCVRRPELGLPGRARGCT